MGPLERHFFNIGYQIGYQAGYQIGYEEGRKMAIEKVAKSLLTIGKPLELIQKCTGLADAEFQALVASLRLRPASQPKKVSA